MGSVAAPCADPELSRLLLRARPSSIRRSALSRTVLAALPLRACCRCCFMLGVTSLLWATTVRLYGQRAALLATALFATLAGTQFLGAFATFDAMALFLLALAAWLGVRSADCQFLDAGSSSHHRGRHPGRRGRREIRDGPVYSGRARCRGDGGMAAARGQRGADGLLTVLCSWLVLVVAAIAAGGREYWLGITTSTLARPQSNVPVTTFCTERVRVDEPDSGPGRPWCGAGQPQRSTRRSCWLPSWRPPPCWSRPSRPGCIPRSACRSTWCSAPGSPRSPPGYAMARLSRVDPGCGWAAVMAMPIAASTLFGSMGQAASLS